MKEPDLNQHLITELEKLTRIVQLLSDRLYDVERDIQCPCNLYSCCHGMECDYEMNDDCKECDALIETLTSKKLEPS